ncbi:pirin family protein [Pleionea mediterranea]
MMKQRNVAHIITGRPASDGAGVKLTRLIGNGGLKAFDPFLMLDEFNSDNADDYIAGFPSHPHRGFETVTYMLEGNMLHRDHMDNEGLLQSGDVQWMTAARGIIHSEMPQQVEGKMRGFQLWINLPAAEKMNDPHYKDIKSKDIPVVETKNATVKVIAGELTLPDDANHNASSQNPIQGAVSGISTAPIYLDVALKAGEQFNLPVPAEHAVMVYVYEGSVTLGDKHINAQQMAQTGNGDQLTIDNPTQHSSHFLVLAGKPLNEPIANWGPFVMNTPEQIEQAVSDYRNGRLTE